MNVDVTIGVLASQAVTCGPLAAVAVALPGGLPVVTVAAWITDAMEIWVTDDGIMWAGTE